MLDGVSTGSRSTSNVSGKGALNLQERTSLFDCLAFQINEISIHELKFVVFETDQIESFPLIVLVVATGRQGEGFGSLRRQMLGFSNCQLL